MLNPTPSSPHFDQCYFFGQLRQLSVCTTKRCFAEELSEILHQSIKNIYKKLNGRVGISLEEAVLLCDYFEVDFGQSIDRPLEERK